jgi:RNA polymerase sigma-70 factor (ECF subfamily)
VGLALTIVRRKVARQWRRHRRQQRLEMGDSIAGNLPALLLSLSSPDADPAAEATLRDQIERLLSQLGDTERRVMELRLEGFTTAEVARQLGLDSDVLRVRLSRLRRRLRDQGVLSEWL